MGFLSFFKAAPKVVDDVFDKDSGLLTQVGSWIGNSNFTPEEAAEMNAKTFEDVRAYSIATMSESTDRSKTRRNIAELIIKFYVGLIFLTGMVYPIDPEWSNRWFELATSWTLGGMVTSISVFFYGSHALAKHQEGKK
jgi:hypothetical protein